ncbi:NCA2-domain-containing protein [Sparassis crispa]|uniref:NCA2-domain-containing protein n=1 Tax=Sparassis crispa TaxID=139825 RepID=A0A401GS47_9APHY|nr:NCA2-domain-containing protein [Sparassis crispa]GBE85062.1 NCA2-domain-containing protein [Sparassis crispa]
MSTFVGHLTRDLSQRIVPPTTSAPPSPPGLESHEKHSLRTLFLGLNHPLSLDEVTGSLHALPKSEHFHAAQADDEEGALQRAILGRLAVELYGHALHTFLQEASDAENELEWWNDIERSRVNLAMYLLQTLPARIIRLSNTILSTLRTRNLPLHLSLLTPSSLRQLFSSSNILRPNPLTIALFPHLHYQPYSIALSTAHFPSTSAFATSPRASVESAFKAMSTSLSDFARSVVALITLPLELTKGECRYKQQELKRIRDERAEILGTLADMRDLLASAVDESAQEQSMTKLAEFTSSLQGAVQDESAALETSPVHSLRLVAGILLPTHISIHAVDTRGLMRPSRLTLLWPRLVLLPPLVLYGVRMAYASRASLEDVAWEAVKTLRGFWEGWLIEPLKGVIDTVQASRDDGVIITRESVKADLNSLERMTLALAQEKLHYDVPQLQALSRQVQLGDLTSVMQIYEQDIKSPFNSVIRGTLLRSLFIQVQKAKVDIDQALSGIDKLLKSQELTFAFVGVAPAFAIVYVLVGYIRSLWMGGRGSGRYGGKKRRASLWLKMRRIERILVAQPKSHHNRQHSSTPRDMQIPALTSGLLLLSLSHLRTYAEKHLPANSRLREGFLEDVTDLEDPALGRAEKLRVLDRMWRSWGEVLGWGRVAGEIGLK